MTNGASPTKRPARLGRGLSTMVGANPAVRVESAAINTDHNPNNDGLSGVLVASDIPGARLVMASVDSIVPNPHQPRRVFDEGSLALLASSIKADGVMQPVVVRPVRGGYELVAGERRLRAARMAGLGEIPAIVRDLDDRASAEMALIENLQRADLNPVERATAFRALIDRHGLTQAGLGERLGLDRASIANHLRLLDLGEMILGMIVDGRLGYAHGRALGGVADEGVREGLAVRAFEEGWSVRALEQAVARLVSRVGDATDAAAGGGGEHSATQDQRGPDDKQPGGRARAVLDDMERRLGEHLGTRVSIRTGRGGRAGAVTISFFSLDEFDGLLERLGYQHRDS